jgi:hypothetical protein
MTTISQQQERPRFGAVFFFSDARVLAGERVPMS